MRRPFEEAAVETVPTTSARATGGSALTTGICDTPYSSRMAMADRTVSSGWTWTKDGTRGPSPQYGFDRCPRAHEPVVRHPAVVVDLGEVSASLSQG